MKYSYLTFDCYGTLVDWRSGIEAELRAVLGNIRMTGQELLDAYVEAERGEEMEYKTYRDILRRTVVSLSARLGADVSEKAARRFSESVPRWPAFADTARFLRDMGSRGYGRYILSNVDTDLLQETLARNGLEVDGFVTAEEVRSYKPEPGHWMRFMQMTGAENDEILHVAQSVFHDIIPTQKLGISSAWVNRYGERLPLDAAPSIIADSLKSLGEVLE